MSSMPAAPSASRADALARPSRKRNGNGFDFEGLLLQIGQDIGRRRANAANRARIDQPGCSAFDVINLGQLGAMMKKATGSEESNRVRLDDKATESNRVRLD